MKGHWVKDYTKRNKDEKSKKYKKKIDIEKGKHGNSVIDHNEAFVITTISMSIDDS
jgi:V8-like Glu-specific endopeptidase